MTRWNYTKGAHDLGDGAYAYLQPDEGSGWGWANSGLIVDGKESLLVDTLRDEKLTKAMLDAMRDATGLAARVVHFLDLNGGDVAILGQSGVREPRAPPPIRAYGLYGDGRKDGDHWFGNRLMAHADIIASQATAEAMNVATPELFRQALKNRPEGIVGDFIWKIHGPPFDFEGVDPVRPNNTF